MPRSTTVLLEGELLAALFEAWDLWSKIRDGRLSSAEVVHKEAPSKTHRGGASQILKHSTSTEVHVCTTHRIIDPEGTVRHWDEADVKVSGLTLAKRPTSLSA